MRPEGAAQAHPRCVLNGHREALGGNVQEGGPWGVAALPEEALAGGGHGAQEAAPGGRAAAGARARGAAAGAQRCPATFNDAPTCAEQA